MDASLIALVPLVAALAQPSDSPRSFADVPELADLPPRIEQAIEELGVPGCAIAAIRDGKLLAVHCAGVRNPAGEPVDADTMFYIASVTKTFTAAAAALLAERGELDLDEVVEEYLPRFTLADEEAALDVTVRDLLCHRAAINSFPIVFLDAYTGQITEDRYYHWLARAERGDDVEYTNVNFTLAGRVLEACEGEPWKDVLDELLFQPAGMTRTTAYASRMYSDPNCAIPMELGPNGFAACAARKTDRTMHAAGGSGTTARDAARWIELMLGDGAAGERRVLAPETARGLRARESDVAPNGRIRRLDGFGLAWFLGTYRGRPYVTHGGGYVGTAAHLSFLPEDGLGVVVLANASPAGQALSDVASIDVYDRLLGETGHGDLLPAYVRELRAERAASTPPPAGDLIASGRLELAPAAYVGRYVDTHWGELELMHEGGELAGWLGDQSVTMLARGEPGAFEARLGSGRTVAGEFLVEDGAVRAILFEEGPYRMRFERPDGER
ncbi:MAG: serine hydrolase domain-containing protein [Planctomycetota bacterium]